MSRVVMMAALCVGVAAIFAQQNPPAHLQLAHFHHVHINSLDPEASIRFYTSRFNSERAKLGGTIEAVWAQKSAA